MYSVWLRIGNARGIQKAINSDAVRRSAQGFPAHVTLATGLSTKEAALDFALGIFQECKDSRKIKIHPKPIAVLDRMVWSTVVVMKVELGEGISRLLQLPYYPPITLIYENDATQEMRIEKAVAFEKELAWQNGKLFEVEAIALEVWLTPGDAKDVGHWKMEKGWDLDSALNTTDSPRFIDVAFNINDDMFSGIYHGKQKHEPDLGSVIERAKRTGVQKFLVLASTIEELKASLSICDRIDPHGLSFYIAAGVHPTQCSDFDPGRLEELRNIISENLDRIVAIGEIGLDGDREHFCTLDKQVEGFRMQLEMARRNFQSLPIVFHLRGDYRIFELFQSVIITSQKSGVVSPLKGVVHSFTGTPEHAIQIVRSGLCISLNGCSLREEIFLANTLQAIPLESLLFETDAPYCDVRPTHPGYKYLSPGSCVACKSLKSPDSSGQVTPFCAFHATLVSGKTWTPGTRYKGRNEPGGVVEVARVVAGALGLLDEKVMVQQVWDNTMRVFPGMR